MHKLLLIEDDPVNSSNINKLLSGFCQIHTTSTTDIGIHLANANKYSLVMIDVNLRSTSTGIGTANSIKNISGYDSIPIVAFVITKLDESKEFLLARGYTHLITEPYNSRNFAQQIKFILSSKQNSNNSEFSQVGKNSVAKIEY
ncbi:MAG TPA: response regulator [Ignavibacteriaceae bacterium]|nr:response regulator [Ignavibacteriaceae bacterium]